MSTQPSHIGRAPIYWQVPRYIHFNTPFHAYAVRTPHWSGEVNVSSAFLHYYEERLAVALTAWGEVKARFGDHLEAICARHGRHEVRKAFIDSIEYERMF